MPLPQLQMFETPCTLEAATLEQRAAAAQELLAAGPTDQQTREELLVLVLWPAAWSEVER